MCSHFVLLGPGAVGQGEQACLPLRCHPVGDSSRNEYDCH